MAELNGAKNISVDIYKIISENSEKMIYICPYAHDSSIAPKGFKLVSEEFIKNEPWSLKNFMVDFAVDEKTALRLRQLDLKEIFDELKYNKPTDYTWDRYYKEYASFNNTLKEAGYILVDGGIEKNTQSEISSVDNNRNEDSQIHSEPNHESYEANKEVTYKDFLEKGNYPKNNSQTEVLFCRKCGSKLIQGSIFCNKCGTKVI
ncbi:MAG: zinc ribbon domain-containing protein [Oscillospiraceae bacterium]|nr:zinc ribbon domain-containing protein [Oscillospiraceae bacterium]